MKVLAICITVMTMVWASNLYGQGSVKFHEDSNISSLMRRWVGENRSEETTRGWRVQIITTDNRRKMEAAMSKFHNLYPGEKVSWSHVPPYYKVQVGAFEKKLELMDFLNTLKEDFPSVIPIPADIEKSDFIRI